VSINVQDVMITDVITIKPDLPVKYADSLMKYYGVSCLVVVEDRLPIGIITENDIVRRVYLPKHDPHFLLVREVMSESLIWVKPETPLHEAAELMIKKKIKRLPVIGSIATGPVLLGLLTWVQMEAGEEKAEAETKK
jgi:CBS domain-containing protein